jgi:hypothetical protein
MISDVIHADVTTHACLFQRRAKPCFFKPLTELDAAKNLKIIALVVPSPSRAEVALEGK